MFSSQNSQVSSAANYIEDVFQTWLYTGNGSTQTITNGIDLSTKGGLVWTKVRSTSGFNHMLSDTARGAGQALFSDLTSAQANYGSAGIGFTTSGFTVGAGDECNSSGKTLVGWTFRKQPKFFDVVTWSGNDTTKVISHSLGSVPGCIIVKSLLGTGNWQVWHRGLTSGNYIRLNTTAAETSTGAQTVFGNNSTTVDPTSTGFTVGSSICADGENYVAYLFAHDAGGFGLTGTDNVISCGSFTTDGSGNATVNLGYEPQWILVKPSSTSGNWLIYDTMRGWAQTSDLALYPNLSNAELQQWSSGLTWSPTATGFQSTGWWAASQTYIYIAIRRGPMKVPTSGTSVFSPNALNAPADGTQVTTNFPVDLSIWKSRGGAYSGQFQDRLRGLPSTAGTGTATLYPDSTSAESDNQSGYQYWNTGFKTYSAENNIWWTFRRAPSFFDEVCYTGDGTNGKAYNHNLTVVPELVIVKSRSNTANWKVLYQPAMRVLTLNTTAAYESAGNTQYYFGNDTIAISPTSTQFTVSNGGSLNVSGATYVTYLFATCAGVSKVGSYTGTGTTLQVDCGFTGGARFVLIKRTDSTGDWYVWDSARGIVSGNDPYLLLNSTAAEVTNTDYVDTYSAGFEISSTAPAAINASGGTFIFLAIA